MPPSRLLQLLKFENHKGRFIILSLVFIVFISLFVLLHHKIDYIVNLYFGIPILLATYYYGFLRGLILLCLQISVHIIILNFSGEDYSFIYQNNRIIIAFISLLIIMYIISLVRIIKNRLIESEKRYKEISDELQKSNFAKDKFFSIIGHDLRSPISSICTNIDMLIDTNNDFSENEKNEILKSVQRVTSQVMRLLENLLEWATIQKPEIKINPVSLPIYELCENCMLLYYTQAGDKKINLLNRIDENLTVFADKNCMETVIRNLISNAIKFTYEGGLVSLDAEEKENTVCITVKDNGIGMNQELIDKLFDIRYDVVNSGTKGESGTGLGLILCNCNGTLTVESHVLIGTSITIELPKIL